MWLKSQRQISKDECCRVFCLKGVLTQNFNTVDLVKKFEKIQKLRIRIVAVTLKMTSFNTMSKKEKRIKVKNQDSMGKTKFFLSTKSYSLWAILAT
jgi:hypothetical protein